MAFKWSVSLTYIITEAGDLRAACQILQLVIKKYYKMTKILTTTNPPVWLTDGDHVLEVELTERETEAGPLRRIFIWSISPLSGVEAAIPAANIKHLIFHKYFQIVIIIHKRFKVKITGIFQTVIVVRSLWYCGIWWTEVNPNAMPIKNLIHSNERTALRNSPVNIGFDGPLFI